jgi:lipopolysaccharide transport system permease protein
VKTLNRTGFARARTLLINLTLRENRSKYKRSVLGWAWSMVNPIGTMLIFTFVFRLVLRIEPPVGDPSGLSNFPLFLISGLLPWNFLANGLTAANGSIVGNAGLIKKVYFSRAVLPAAAILSWNTNLLVELGVLTIALFFFGKVILLLIPVAVIIVAVQTIFVLGIGIGLSALNVYFRDIEHFLQILLLLWFYATPIIYPVSYVPEVAVIGGLTVPVHSLYNLNPMVHFAQAYRAVFYDIRVPSGAEFLRMTLSAAVAMLVGMWIFRKLEARFAEEL